MPRTLGYVPRIHSGKPPYEVFKCGFAIVFAICSIGLGFIFLIGCIGEIGELTNQSRSRRETAQGETIRILACSVITIGPGIYYGRAAMRELNQKQ